MPYDEHLATRALAVLSDHPGVSTRKMFGGIAYMLDGHMFGGIVGPDLIVRLGADTPLDEPHMRPMDFTGRPLKGIFFVAPAGVKTDRQLWRWLERAMSFVRTLPAKRRTLRPKK